MCVPASCPVVINDWSCDTWCLLVGVSPEQQAAVIWLRCHCLFFLLPFSSSSSPGSFLRQTPPSRPPSPTHRLLRMVTELEHVNKQSHNRSTERHTRAPCTRGTAIGVLVVPCSNSLKGVFSRLIKFLLHHMITSATWSNFNIIFGPQLLILLDTSERLSLIWLLLNFPSQDWTCHPSNNFKSKLQTHPQNLFLTIYKDSKTCLQGDM